MDYPNTNSIAEEVEDIRRNTVSVESRRLYQRSIGKYLLWTLGNNAAVVTSALSNALSGLQEKEQIKEVLRFISDKSNGAPIYFHLVTASDFVAWLVSMRKPDGKRPGYSTYNSHRAALFNPCTPTRCALKCVQFCRWACTYFAIPPS